MTNLDNHSPQQETNSLQAWLAFTLGIYFSLLQFSYFFLMEAYVSSRSISFFFVLFFWLMGFLGGLNIKHSKLSTANRSPSILSHRLLPILVGISIASYYVTLVVVKQNPYSYSNFFIVGIAAILSGLAPGYYFIWAKKRFSKVKHLFFHENNGFILGIVFSLAGALFAGAWLLNWAALLSLVPVVLMAKLVVSFDGKGQEKQDAEKGESPLFPYLQGFHFGLLQVALYLMVQSYYSASYVGYFLIVLAWMAGVFIGLKWLGGWRLRQVGYVSLAAYFTLLLLLSLLAPYTLLMPVIALFSVLVALPVGVLFRDWSEKLTATSLFFHENNGFIFGYLVSMLSFVQWGVHALYWGPLLSFAITLLANQGRSAGVLIFFPIIALAVWFAGGGAVALSLLLTGALGIALLKKSSGALSVSNTVKKSWTVFTALETKVILVLAGMCLLLLQYLITREFSIVLASSELSILVVAIAYFCGLSIGYGLLKHVSLKLLQPLAVVMFVLHLVILPIIKPIYGVFISFGWGLEVLWGVLFITAFFTSAFYSVLLPRLIEANGSKSLTNAYSWDLLGVAIAVVLMLVLVYWWPAATWPLYLLSMSALVAILLKGTRYDRAFLAMAWLVISVFSAYQAEIFTAATEDYYRSRDYDNPKLIFSQNSIYNAIDIVESYADKEQTEIKTRTSFLNGVSYFNQKFSRGDSRKLETGLGEFTYFLAELPAKFLAERRNNEKLRILILGAGSMSSMERVRPYSSKTTLVELDALVVESAQKHWSDVNGFAGTHDNEEIVIDDAKHYLMTSNEKFDLIIMDISAPYHLGTMMLHNREFFRLVRSRLKWKGMFAESTQSRPRRNAYNSTAMRILSAVDEVFPYWNIVSTGGKYRGNHGYVYAFRKDMTSSKKIINHLVDDGYRQGSYVYSNYSNRYKLRRVEPFSITNMDSLLTSNKWRISDRLMLDNEKNSAEVMLSDFLLIQKVKQMTHSIQFWLLLLALSIIGFLLIRSQSTGKDESSSLFDRSYLSKKGLISNLVRQR